MKQTEMYGRGAVAGGLFGGMAVGEVCSRARVRDLQGPHVEVMA